MFNFPKDGAISQDMKQLLIQRFSKADSLKGNPKLLKNNAHMGTIVNWMNTLIKNIAEKVFFLINIIIIK